MNREYAVRRVRDAFKEHKNEQDPKKITSLLKSAEENLDIIRRQVIVSFYSLILVLLISNSYASNQIYKVAVCLNLNHYCGIFLKMSILRSNSIYRSMSIPSIGHQKFNTILSCILHHLEDYYEVELSW